MIEENRNKGKKNKLVFGLIVSGILATATALLNKKRIESTSGAENENNNSK